MPEPKLPPLYAFVYTAFAGEGADYHIKAVPPHMMSKEQAACLLERVATWEALDTFAKAIERMAEHQFRTNPNNTDLWYHTWQLAKTARSQSTPSEAEKP